MVSVFFVFYLYFFLLVFVNFYMFNISKHKININYKLFKC